MVRNTSAMEDIEGFFTPTQIKKLLAACNTQRDVLLIETLYYTGRRVTEVVGRKAYTHKYIYKEVLEERQYEARPGLVVKDIDIENARIVWDILKKGRFKDGIAPKRHRRWKSADPTLLRKLDQYIRENQLEDTDRVFPLHRNRVYQIVSQAAERAGIPLVGTKKPHPHHLRHSFAVRVAETLESPADLVKLSGLLGHSSVGVTQIYLQFGSGDEGELLERAFKDQ